MALGARVGGERPLSHAQHGLWFAQHAARDGARSTPAEYPDLRGAVDPVRLTGAWRRTVRASDAVTSGGSLLGAALLRLADDRSLFYRRFHHVLVDGLSVAALSRAFARCYRGDPVRFRSADAVLAAEQDYRGSAEFRADAGFWSAELADAITLAATRAEQAGVADRLRFVEGDAFAPDTWLAEVDACDLYVAVGALHEHFRNGDQAVIDLLSTYADRLREGRTLLLGEPELHVDAADADFCLVHVLTDQGFPQPRSRWREVIAAAGLTCTRTLSAPNTGFRFAYYEITA